MRAILAAPFKLLRSGGLQRSQATSRPEAGHRHAFRGESVRGSCLSYYQCAVRQPAASRTLRAAQERLQAQSLTRLPATRRVESRRRDGGTGSPGSEQRNMVQEGGRGGGTSSTAQSGDPPWQKVR